MEREIFLIFISQPLLFVLYDCLAWDLCLIKHNSQLGNACRWTATMVLQLPSTARSETYVISTVAAEKKSARLLNKAAELGCSSGRVYVSTGTDFPGFFTRCFTRIFA
jgi:hypothetical protein